MSKTVIVTGGTRGIGAAVAELFLNDGFRVCAVYRSNDAAANEFSARMNTERLIIKKTDVSDYDAVTRLYNDVYKEFGRLDISVHAAGIELSKMLALTSAEDWKRIIDVNLGGVFYCSKCALKKMLINGYGRIINLSSAAAEIPNEGQGAYSASKAGVNALTKILAKEAAPFGVTVNAVAPAFVRTDMFAPYEEKYKAEIPLGRFAEPREAAALVRYLASDEAAYITGSVYKIGGGI